MIEDQIDDHTLLIGSRGLNPIINPVEEVFNTP